MIPTPHIELNDKSKIAKTVLMPGDPLRAKYVAELFLTDIIQINSVRNMLGYTGKYNGKPITIFASGMGLSSIGIYSYELYKFYDVDNIIRIGSAGAYTEELKMYDIVLAKDAYSESNYAKTQHGVSLADILEPSKILVEKLETSAKRQGISYTKGRIHTSEVFYHENENYFKEVYRKRNCLCAEMEAFALFHNANICNKNAACVLTISDSLVTHEVTTSKEREQSFTDMMKMALGTVELE